MPTRPISPDRRGRRRRTCVRSSASSSAIPEVSEAVYRLLKAAREGRRLQEEVRVAGLRGEPARWLRHARASARQTASAKRATRSGASPTSRATASGRKTSSRNCSTRSTISITRRPASSRSMPTGDIVYLNATLAELARPRSRRGRLRRAEARRHRVRRRRGAADRDRRPRPARSKTEVLDLDFKTRGGRPCRCGCFTRSRSAPTARPAPSRTLVLNRARDDGTDAQRAAEVRFMRFFNNTPMAIATVDRSGTDRRAPTRCSRGCSRA